VQSGFRANLGRATNLRASRAEFELSDYNSEPTPVLRSAAEWNLDEPTSA